MHDRMIHQTEPPTVRVLHLVLPVPPSVNDWPSHPMELHKAKCAYMREAWVAALGQHMPMADPPERAVLFARFYTWNLRDEDNLKGSMKWLVDSLKQEQTGAMRWRDGIAETKGYYVDDSPRHLTILEPVQQIDRESQRVEVTLRWRTEAIVGGET